MLYRRPLHRKPSLMHSTVLQNGEAHPGSDAVARLETIAHTRGPGTDALTGTATAGNLWVVLGWVKWRRRHMMPQGLPIGANPNSHPGGRPGHYAANMSMATTTSRPMTTTITLPNLPRDQAGLSTSDGDEQRRQSLIPEGFQCWWNAFVIIFQLPWSLRSVNRSVYRTPFQSSSSSRTCAMVPTMSIRAKRALSPVAGGS